ncbi:hypothetical protein [Salinibius halmophilus]|uniref:hypothetical protein n=1 Tax=Salinibius halmophilus TaxID=1853216 RepID=UPI000E66F498|nr:hypothetical protein [Salinibius halmophilus]
MYKLKTLSVLVAAVAFAGCDAGIQDGSDPTLSGMNGLVVDGRVANGKVWADRDNDGAIDDFEPFAWTDAQGYYSYNPQTDTDYCAATAEDQLKHCLRYGSSSDNVVIRIRGGIDLDTGEKLKGIMAMDTTISASEAKSDTPQVLSPLTTLLQSVPANEKQNMRNALGITSDADLRRDFSSAESEADRAFYAKALAVQTILDVAFSAGESDSTKQLAALGKLAEKIASIGDVTSLETGDLTEVLESAGVPTEKRTNVSERLRSVNQAISLVATTGSAEDVKKRIKAIEVVSQLVKQEADGETVAALGDVGDDRIGSVVNSVQGALGDNEQIDITSVSKAIKDGGDPATAVNDNKLASEVEWAGSWFLLRPDQDTIEDLNDGDFLAFYFFGTGEETSGSIGICTGITKDDLGDEVPDLDGTYFGGSWSELSKGQVSFIVNYEGQEFSGQMKVKAFDANDADAGGEYKGQRMQQIRFTSDLAEDESFELLRDVTSTASVYLTEAGANLLPNRTDSNCDTISSNVRQNDTNQGW